MIWKLAERMHEIYIMLYKINDNIPNYAELVDLGDRIMTKTPDELAALTRERHDIITSDREVVAYLLALLTIGMNWNATLTLLETFGIKED